MGLNPKVFGFLALFAIIFIITWGLPLTFPHPVKENVTPNVTIIYKEKIVLVTPTVDGHIYYAGEYQNGTRLLKHPFTWIRYNAITSIDNPEGKTKDMKVTCIVYDYRYFEKLHWFNPASYKYQEMIPSREDKKFLGISVYLVMDDKGGDDTRMYAVNRSLFNVFDGKENVKPLEYPYQLRFREYEETYTFNNDARIQAYKSFRAYSSDNAYVKTAGEYNDELYYLKGGQSNAIDGYLLFEVDKDSQPIDTLVLAQFYTFGYSSWRLEA
jgi:hypothetical protein